MVWVMCVDRLTREDFGWARMDPETDIDVYRRDLRAFIEGIRIVKGVDDAYLSEDGSRILIETSLDLRSLKTALRGLAGRFFNSISVSWESV